MQDLIRQYLDHHLGRRGFFERMAGLGFTLAAAKAYLAPLDASERVETSSGSTVEGTGGELIVAPAKAAGTDLEAALKRGISATRDGKPYLVEVVIARCGGSADSTWYEKFNLAEKRKQRV